MTMVPQFVPSTTLKSLLDQCQDLAQADQSVDSSPLLYLLLSKSKDALAPYFTERSCRPGEIVMREGEAGESMFLVFSGQAVVFKGEFSQPVVLGTCRSGSILGEMALLENAPRSATVVALEPLTLLSISRDKFFELLAKYPAVNQSIISMLCARLRLSDEQRRHDFYIQKQLQHQVHAMEEVQAVNEKAYALIATLREQTVRDPLTGLYNRRYLDETLEREISRARRENSSIAVIMMDVDHFKRINDAYGHRGGDLLLQALGRMLPNWVREEDIVCRYGGEEFVIVLPGAQEAAACRRAEIIRMAFEEMVTYFEGCEIRATLSLGVAALPAQGLSGSELIEYADRALYAAKQSGRNRVSA